MIDARSAVGVPCITTCPVIISSRFLLANGVELDEWQMIVMRGHGFLFTEDDRVEG